ncbi:hypothetical protein OYT00_01950 [Microbacterium paraoxydans]|uniref:DUF7169 domain-containing protein n=1 Tax=Microbacterium paraoxydans TaxID=199592 RepID=UPI0022856995|nr:hypothetical protein [Microbacterium paraoxydans]MCZ0708750.1 hypothetical protein [Microbacterium paraoxydans]
MADAAEPGILEPFAAAYLRLRALTDGPDLAEAQWMAGRSPVPREDTTERAKNTTADPVLFALTDPRRVALRDSVQAAERALRHAEYTMGVAVARLEAAARSSCVASESPGPS